MGLNKQHAGVAVGTAVLITGAITALAPSSSDPGQREREQLTHQTEQLSDAQEREHDRMRQSGDDLADAVEADRNRPGEHRPPEPHLRLRVIP